MATSALFWENSDYGPGDTNATYEFLSSKSPNRYHLMRLLRKKGMREVGEILFTALAENTPSDTASVTIDSDKDDATAETSRAATAADVTTLNAELIPSGATANRAPATYPTDASGNGGGGKFDQGF